MCRIGKQKTFETIALSAYKKKRGSCSDFSSIQLKGLAKARKKACKCDDEYVAILTVNVDRSFEGSVCWKTDKEIIKNRNQTMLPKPIKEQDNLPTIALVLESPHISEFFKDSNCTKKRTPPRPAMGTTGLNIIEYFPETLLKYLLQRKIENGAITKTVRDIENGDYRLVLVNTIQYQCSLGEKPDEYRDDVFSECFNNPVFKNDFVERLKGYSPSIIINCCTGGEKASGFNSQIQSLINEKFPSVLRLKGYHPSSIYFVVGFEKEP